MKIKDTDTCYICGRKARSSEHAPAKCFFPSDRRSNLIQVPSCEEHNERTSKNDEYLLFIISSHFNNNQIGFDQSVKKGIKTLKRSEALAKTLSENARIASVINSKSVSYNTTAIKIDRQRFDNEIKKIASLLVGNSGSVTYEFIPEPLKEKLRLTQYMRNELKDLEHYAVAAGKQDEVLNLFARMESEGRIPVTDKKKGREVLDEIYACLR